MCCALCAQICRGVRGHAPPGKFLKVSLLRMILSMFWGNRPKSCSYRTHLKLRPPPLFCWLDLATSMGGLIMVISLIYMPPFLTVERARETVMAELSVSDSCGLHWSLQWLSSAEQKIINQWRRRVCAVRKHDAVFAPPPASYGPVAVQPITGSVYCWPVGS